MVHPKVYKNFINGQWIKSHTGNGHREACVQALEVFSEWKSVCIDFSGVIRRAQIDNQYGKLRSGHERTYDKCG